MSVLRALEDKDYIEILDETDPKNAVCRFRKSFFRETIYQVMLYRVQKKGLHQLFATFIQENPNEITNDPETEADILLTNILLAEDLQNEADIPTKSKQGLIVKKIATMLEKNPLAVIMRGMLTKQGDKPNKNVEYRLLLVSAKDIKWYHDEEELKKGKRPLGVIYMSAVYHCVPANTKMNTVDINVSAKLLTLCIDRDVRVAEERPREGGEEGVHIRGQEHHRARRVDHVHRVPEGQGGLRRLRPEVLQHILHAEERATRRGR